MDREPSFTELMNRSLRYAHGITDDLIEMTAEWDDIPDIEQASFLADWDQFAQSILPHFEEELSNGRMTPAQEAEYQRLLRRIEQNLPLVRRFNLTMPRVPAER